MDYPCVCGSRDIENKGHDPTCVHYYSQDQPQKQFQSEDKPWRIIPPEYTNPNIPQTWEEKTQKPTVADEAKNLVEGHRQRDYGHPSTDFSRTAKLWNALFDTSFTPEDVATALRMVKESRLRNSPRHKDSLVDIVGYALTQEMIWEKDNEGS